ncbi:MAG: hypothetical protein IJ642_10130 [Oscillospiraceae bacterium]|nr:hypothetical protein [Oscillospiraceae bacterium]
MFFDFEARRSAEVELLKDLVKERPRWSRNALLFRVRNGEGTFRSETCSSVTNKFFIRQQLFFEDQPLYQMNTKAMESVVKPGELHFGYGMENINSPELKAVRKKLDAGFSDLHSSLEDLRPLLGKLSDGYYILAETELIPTDGCNHFFWNSFGTYPALAGGYDNYWLREFKEGFPAYLFPTKSSGCFDPERGAYYEEIMKQGQKPYALAFYEYGFMNALLEGHHKAWATARLGLRLPCLLLIPVTGRARFDFAAREYTCAEFAGITIPIDELEDFEDLLPADVKDMELYHHLLFREQFWDKDFRLHSYPDLQELTDRLLVPVQESDFTPENVELWLKEIPTRIDKTSKSKFRCAFRSWMRTNPRQARKLAQDHIELQDEEIFRDIWEMLRYDRSPETEAMFREYLQMHDSSYPYWEIVQSYWKK